MLVIQLAVMSEITQVFSVILNDTYGVKQWRDTFLMYDTETMADKPKQNKLKWPFSEK